MSETAEEFPWDQGTMTTVAGKVMRKAALTQ